MREHGRRSKLSHEQPGHLTRTMHQAVREKVSDLKLGVDVNQSNYHYIVMDQSEPE